MKRYAVPFIGRWRPSLGLAAGVVLFLALGVCSPSHGAAGSAVRRILILSSYHRGHAWTDDIIRGVHQSFEGYGAPVEFYYEFLDTKRHEVTPAYFALMADVIGHRYRARKPDIVILCDNNAFDFVVRYREQIFSGVPVVFTGINNYVPAMRERIPNSTGVSEVKAMGETLNLALRLHPAARTLAIVSDGTTTGRIDAELVRQAARAHGNLEILELSGEKLSLDELLSQLRGLSDAVVFHVSFWRDRTGDTFRADKLLPLMSEEAPAPIYSHSDTYIGLGVVGGIMTHGVNQGELAGQMTIRILDGTRADTIPVATKSNVPMFDHVQLERWGIRREDLPADAVIVNEPPPSFYERYTGLIWGVAAAFSVLLILVGGLATNIVFRRRAENALRASEARYRQLVESAPLPIVVHREGRFLFVNHMALRLYGAEKPEDLIGKKLEDFIHPDDRSRFEHRAEKFRSNVEPYSPHTALRIARVDGQVADIEATSILTDYGGQDAFLAVCLDVTERKRAERERRRLETQVQQAQKLESLGVLAGGIAHDFNNLLMGVMGNADLMRLDLSADSPALPRVRDIEKSARRAADLCQQMLAYSGKGRFEISRFSVSDIVSEMVHILRVSISKKARLVFDFQDHLPLIEGDATQMRQVVMNLVTNASEAIGETEGTITVRTSSRDCSTHELEDEYLHEPRPDGTYVVLEVIDTGCGMDAETRNRLFDPFFSTKFTGRGLGLAAVLGIVRGHRGAVQVESRPGEGATIRIFMPAAHEESKAEPETPEEEPVERPEDWIGSGTVLLVDDEDAVVNVAREMLERLGFDVLVARDGREAVSIFRRHAQEVECVLLDLTMPRMDGEECFTELRRIRADVPVILSSGYNQVAATKRFLGKGLADFVQKPYRTEVLRDALQRLLGDSNDTV